VDDIDFDASALKPVRARVSVRIDELTQKVVNPHTPLDHVPGYRGEIAALRWLLVQLEPPKEIVT
jgi:hypothetical protein